MTMTRFERRNRKDIKYQLRGPVFDAVDNFMKEIWRMSDDEYDYMCLNLSDDELNIFGLFSTPSISELKLIIKRTNELIDIKNNTPVI